MVTRAKRRWGLISWAYLLALLITSCGGPASDPLDARIEGAVDTLSIEEADLVPVEDSITIRFGSSSGMCIGYCKHEYALHSWGMDCWRRGWESGGDTSKYPTQHQFIRRIDLYREAVAALDTSVFWNAPGIIGCPDCADGGSCWVEVTWGEKRKMVTYDCPTDIGELRPFVSKLYALVGTWEWPSEDPLYPDLKPVNTVLEKPEER